eukprot:NODE_7769_length_744_cov_17.552335_g7155_i0.p1 GENE.NODE_7769_length_744_cov_17.552335_g7155_i0~~NODE_7769_length_744_cov_17.552335_g7155_i0.p1  ORF type:complete len:221 (-),score=32.11 NODE_7769_length_744_cov_17.552335_g7155_i0:81-704(-)
MATRKVLLWKCDGCDKGCVTIREECRCMCGHRWREHQHKQEKNGTCCNVSRCPCKSFFYIVAEGTWVLHCRCKHKHIDHDPRPPYKCNKCATKPTSPQCNGFDSPWVCNCDHPWSEHALRWEDQKVKSPFEFDENIDPSTVMRGLDYASQLPSSMIDHINPVHSKTLEAPSPLSENNSLQCSEFQPKKFSGPLSKWCQGCNKNISEH